MTSEDPQVFRQYRRSTEKHNVFIKSRFFVFIQRLWSIAFERFEPDNTKLMMQTIFRMRWSSLWIFRTIFHTSHRELSVISYELDDLFSKFSSFGQAMKIILSIVHCSMSIYQEVSTKMWEQIYTPRLIFIIHCSTEKSVLYSFRIRCSLIALGSKQWLISFSLVSIAFRSHHLKNFTQNHSISVYFWAWIDSFYWNVKSFDNYLDIVTNSASVSYLIKGIGWFTPHRDAKTSRSCQ